MGCDIHLFVEKRVDGNWVPATNDNWNPNYSFQEEDPKDRYMFHAWRDYDLFGLLSGVRRPLNLQLVPKDQMEVPGDLSDQIKESLDWIHSIGHMSLADFLSIDWDAKIHQEEQLVRKPGSDFSTFNYYLPGDGIHPPRKPSSNEEFIEFLNKRMMPDPYGNSMNLYELIKKFELDYPSAWAEYNTPPFVVKWTRTVYDIAQSTILPNLIVALASYAYLEGLKADDLRLIIGYDN